MKTHQGAPKHRNPEDPVCRYSELLRRQSVDAAAKAEREAASYLQTEPQVDVDDPSPWDLFPNALRAIVAHSVYGSKKHNPGEPVHWAFRKSTGHVEKAIGHLQRAGQTDPETGALHEVNGAWRAVAALETSLIKAGARPGRRVRGAP